MAYQAGTTQMDIQVDREKQIIHILDLNIPFCRTVTNAIDIIQSDIAKFFDIESDKYKWVLYGTDGYIAEFLTGRGFRHVKDNDESVYEPYLSVMLQRR